MIICHSCRCLLPFAVLTVACYMPARADVYTWSGTTSSEVSDLTNWEGGTAPTAGDNLATNNPDWQLPDTLGAGANYHLNLTVGTGPWYVGGNSGGGITFLSGGASPTPYTITGGDANAVLNIAGSTTILQEPANQVSTTDRGYVINNSTVKQTFDLDIVNWQSTFDAAHGDIEIKAGHTFLSGGISHPDGVTGSVRTQHATQFKGDKTIFLNASVLANTSSSTNRGALVYLGADTTPTADSALVLGNIGTNFKAKVLVTSTNGGVVRVTHNDSLGFNDTALGGNNLYGTEIGLRNGLSNGTLEIDGRANNLTVGENFWLGQRTVANGTAHIRNIGGNNTLDGFISLNYTSDPSGNSMFIESTAGNLKINGEFSDDRPNQTSNLFLRGAGKIEIAGFRGIGIAPSATNAAGADLNEILNVVKSESGTTTVNSGIRVDYRGNTTIQGGAFILNGTHAANLFNVTTLALTPVPGGSTTVEANGTLGGSGSTIDPVTLAGKLSPGAENSVGTFTLGGLSLTGGILDFQLNSTNHTAGSSFNDLLVATNNGTLDLTLGATLNVAGIGGNLTAGDYDLIRFGGTTTPVGTAANIALGTIPLGAGMVASIVLDSDSVNLHIATAVLNGDYNGDGKVDAADYVVWRKNPTVVGGGDPVGYNTWRANFGAGGPGSGTGSELASNQSVPEPTSLALVGLLTSLLIVKRRSRGLN